MKSNLVLVLEPSTHNIVVCDPQLVPLSWKKRLWKHNCWVAIGAKSKAKRPAGSRKDTWDPSQFLVCVICTVSHTVCRILKYLPLPWVSLSISFSSLLSSPVSLVFR